MNESQEFIAVYAAFVALQVRDRIRDGLGPPIGTDMLAIVEEARAVAEEAEDMNRIFVANEQASRTKS